MGIEYRKRCLEYALQQCREDAIVNMTDDEIIAEWGLQRSQGEGWQDIASGLAKALRRLAYHAQTSGGTAGHDAGLVAAVDIGLAALREYDTAKHDAPPAAELERAPKQDGLAELRALTRDLPEKNEEVWAAGMNAIRDMLCDLERDDFKDIGNGYPAEIWAAMYDAAKLARTKG